MRYPGGGSNQAVINRNLRVYTFSYQKDSYRKVAPVEKPECPARQPPIAISECGRYDSVLQETLDDGAIIARFDYSCKGDC